MLDCQSRSNSVFDTDRIRRGDFDWPVYGNDRSCSLGQCFEVFISAVDWDKKDAVDRMMHHDFHLCGFNQRISVCCSKPNEIATFMCGLLNGVNDYGKETIGDVGNDQAD